MKLFGRFRGLLEFGPLFAALHPTLLVLIAGAICLAAEDTATPLTLPAVPIHRVG